MRLGESSSFIADSALYSAHNIGELSKVRWLTRVPETLKAAKELCTGISPEQLEAADQEGYRFFEVGSLYGGVKQRWLVVFSQAAADREGVRLSKQVDREREKAEKELKALSRQEFSDPEAARAAVRGVEETCRFHRIENPHLQATAHYGRRGKPKADQPPVRVGWRVADQLGKQAEAVLEALPRQGKFILAPTELDEQKLTASQRLTAYKGPGGSVERGFRFLKAPLFFASSLFVEKPARIMALLMIMGLSLLVYALAEHEVRTELVHRAQSIPDQIGKPTQRPTLRRIFQIFEGIDVLWIQHSRGTQRLLINLKPIHRQILALFGSEVQACYLCDG